MNLKRKISGTLTTIIGIFILYMEPAMMALDMLAALINQRHLIRCIENLERIDEKMANEGVEIDYKPLKRLSIVLIAITFCRNVLMILFGYFGINSNVYRLCIMYVPICISVLSKIYFVLIVSNIRMKFDAINLYLDELANTLNASNQSNSRAKNSTVGSRHSDNGKPNIRLAHQFDHLATGFLPNEVIVKSKPNLFQILPALNLVKPFDAREFIDGGRNNDEIPSIVRYLQCPMNEFSHENNGPIVIGDRFDKRLTNLCFLHDEICEIVGIANHMFSAQMLMLMAYGFLGITAQLYFVYCSLANQVHDN